VEDGLPAHTPPRSPLAERPPLGQVVVASRSPTLHARVSKSGAAVAFFSPKGLPPVRTTRIHHSGLFSHHSALLPAADSDGWEDGKEDCYSGNFSETANEACSSDSSRRKKNMTCGSRKPRATMAIHPENHAFLELRTLS